MNSGISKKFDRSLIWYLTPQEKSEHRDYSNAKIKEELTAICEKRNLKLKRVSFDQITVSIEDGILQIYFTDEDVQAVECFPLVVVLRTGRGVTADSHITVLRHLEMMGCKIINSVEATMCCMNKMWTYQELVDKGFPMPQTFSYGGYHARPIRALDFAEHELTYPIIVKNVRGSHGKQVILVPDSDVNHDMLPVLQHTTPYLFQEYIKESHGMDVRVIVIGGKIIGAMLRQSTNGRVQSNCGAGGSGTPYDLSPEGAALALAVAQCLKLDFCGIDFLLSKQGFVICEVNSNAQFERFDAAMGSNVGQLISELAVAELIRLQEIYDARSVDADSHSTISDSAQSQLDT